MSKAWSLSPDVIFADVEDEVVAMSVENGEYYAFGPEGSRILELVRDGADEEAVVAALTAEYDADEATLREDLAAFMAELVEAKLATEREAG